jgi:hypothetical protein
MRKRHGVVWSAAALGLAVTARWLSCSTEGVETEGVEIDAVDGVYREDAPGARPVAALGARLRARGTVRWLELDVAARGPNVVPVPGLEGVHGVNIKTAHELHRALRDGRLRTMVRARGGSVVGSGEVVAVRSERLPQRRLSGDGDVDLHARTDAQWPVVVTLRSDPLPAVAASFEVFLDGVSRLRVTVADERILAIESLGEPPMPLVRGSEVANEGKVGQ